MTASDHTLIPFEHRLTLGVSIYVGENGVGEMQFFKTGVFLDGDDLPLLDEDGTAIVIHAEEDDQVTQPIGGAGARIACGLVQGN